jgi:Cu2+-exporting ATPase
VKARVENATYSIGGPRLLEQQGWDVPQALQPSRQKAESSGQAVIYLANEAGIIALFAIADVIREESRAAVQKLHDLGVKVAMLTGDSQSVAKAVADELNIDTYFAEVLPEHKARPWLRQMWASPSAQERMWRLRAPVSSSCAPTRWIL